MPSIPLLSIRHLLTGGRFWLSLLLLLCLVALATCGRDQPPTSADGELSGTILFWHSWSDPEATVLGGVIASFMEIHPQVDVKVTAVPGHELKDRYRGAVEAGFGPDLFIGPSTWIRELADARTIRPIEEWADQSIWDRYAPIVIDSVRYQEARYGLPESIQTLALYYNRTLVTTTPAATLDELLAHADQGMSVAMSTGFADAFWGIQAFGGRLFDAEGRVVLDQGGFVNWLAWLRAAQERPNFILTGSLDLLLPLFKQQQVAYMANEPDVLREVQEALGAENVGVAPLPVGLIGPAGPFLDVNAVMFNTASSARQAHVAQQLGIFITNSEQATVLMRQAGRIPANARVKVNPRVDSIANAFVTQSKTAVAFPNIPIMDAVLRFGNDAYRKALQGVLGPIAAVQEVTQLANQANNFETTAAAQFRCEGFGVVKLWHSWTGVDAEALKRLIANFAADCPNIVVRTEGFSATELRSKLEESGSAAAAPDLMLVPSDWLVTLHRGGVVQELTSLVDNQVLQRYYPTAVDTLRSGGRLYGLPLTMQSIGLYANRQLTSEPIHDLSDLLLQAQAGRAVGLGTTFRDAFWGISGFGGALFDEQHRLMLGEGGFTAWLTWLREANQVPGMTLNPNREILKTLFKEGSLAYLAGPSQFLAELETALGRENVLVSLLPAGPEGPSRPLLTTQGFMLHSAASAEQGRLALEFVKYVTDVDAQGLLVSTTRRLPVHITLDVSTDSPVASFLDQAQTAVSYPNVPEMLAVQEFAGDAFALVLDSALEPTDAVAETVNIINQANGIAVTAEAAVVCREAAVQVWHSWTGGPRADLLKSIGAQFIELCPQSELELVAVEPERLLERLGPAAAAGSAPTLLLLPSSWIGDLVEAEQIQEIGALADPLVARRYIAQGVETVRYRERLYGLPVTLQTVVLFYNRDVVTTPAATLDELVDQVRAGRRAGIQADLYHSFWGIQAFGGRPLGGRAGEGNDGGSPDTVALADWMGWLLTAHSTLGITLDASPDKLAALFKSGRLAYYAGASEQLSELQTSLRTVRVGVAPLPPGPADAAGPLLTSDAFLLTAGATAAEAELALEFAKFVTLPESQVQLLSAGQMPAARGVGSQTSDGVLAGFLEQMESVIPLPADLSQAQLQATGDDLFQAVLNGRSGPASAASSLVARLRELGR